MEISMCSSSLLGNSNKKILPRLKCGPVCFSTTRNVSNCWTACLIIYNIYFFWVVIISFAALVTVSLNPAFLTLGHHAEHSEDSGPAHATPLVFYFFPPCRLLAPSSLDVPVDSIESRARLVRTQLYFLNTYARGTQAAASRERGEDPKRFFLTENKEKKAPLIRAARLNGTEALHKASNGQEMTACARHGVAAQ